MIEIYVEQDNSLEVSERYDQCQLTIKGLHNKEIERKYFHQCPHTTRHSSTPAWLYEKYFSVLLPSYKSARVKGNGRVGPFTVVHGSPFQLLPK